MKFNRYSLLLVLFFVGASVQSAFAQHLWWDADGQKDATCVYGQITVLATHSSTYYCGVNWHPGEPAGGYCGIQHNSGDEHRTIFSIWDTSPKLHPKVTAADEKTDHGRFGGEGEGGHTHMIWPWKLGETFEFYVTKTPGENDTTDAKYYVFDRETKKWIHSATISCPNGGHAEVGNFSGGGMDAFLENFSGEDKDAPRLAIYRLWIGTDADHLKSLTHAGGDGKWGTLHDAYFLAGGSMENLNGVFKNLEKDYGKPVLGDKETKPDPISEKPIDEKVLKALKHLPTAPEAK
jgi:Domain of unknown function (DUF3472)